MMMVTVETAAAPLPETAEKMVSQAVEIYNNQRLHFSLELQTPENVHQIENVKYKSYKRKKILNLTQQNN